jgi:hypothetical protein
MAKPALTKKRIILAYVVAVTADVLEFPITAIENTVLGFIPGEFADFAVDTVVMGIMTRLLGFHWLFLPSFLLEAVPEVDLFPTWVGCVAYVVWQRKKEQGPPPPPIISEVKVQSSAPPAPKRLEPPRDIDV